MEVETIKEYLQGVKFDDGKFIDVFSERFESRLDALQTIVSKKRCIHLGATDHMPLIEDKIKNNTWLHKCISESAKECVGIDINSEAVDYCNNIGWKNIIAADFLEDIEKVKKYIGTEKWDYIVAGELVEHIDNPIDFLKKINFIYYKNIDRIIITVPNAFNIDNFKSALKGMEGINTDHRYWFTPYTILKVATMAGLEPEYILYTGQKKGKTGMFLKLFKKNICSTGILLVARLRQDN